MLERFEAWLHIHFFLKENYRLWGGPLLKIRKIKSISFENED